ncbi:MAG: diguanylate cyclase [Chromatiaceae bacterium]
MTLSRIHGRLLILGMVFIVAFASLVQLIHRKADDYAVNEAKKQALNALLVHRAIHAYVTKTQRPEIYRLKDEQKLYRDYFAPQTMSFTYISRSIKDLLNDQRQQHGMEPIYFKLASENPRNPINQADVFETALLRRMNRENLTEYQDVVQVQGQEVLYLAVPIERSTPGCMKCHGNPKDAPQELIALYGDKAGFFENPDDIRALISIRVPLAGVFASADQMANVIILVTLAVLTGIYVLIAVFSLRLDAQQQRIVGQNIELSRLSVTDNLTGTLNRLGAIGRLQELASLATRHGHTFALMMLDLDHFKIINDQYGHATGDEVLKGFTETVRAHIRTSDFLCRWGGEEFLLVCPHLDLDNADRLAEKLRQAVESVSFLADIRLTTSIGIAGFKPDESVTRLIERADQALYSAKEAGRNRIASAADPV